jgi:radical SAM superfamily enzyme YgiQ (UPF0313 family)
MHSKGGQNYFGSFKKRRLKMKILLVVYDNDSFLHVFPIGLGYIAAVLRLQGMEVKIWNQDMHHYPDEALTGYLDQEKFDLVGIGVVAGYYQFKKLLALSKAVNRSKNRPIFVLGGHGPSPDPEYFLKKTQADVIVLGEGEDSIIELTRAIAEKRDYRQITGIAVRSGDEIFINARRPLIQEIDEIPFPAYDLFPMEYYRLFRSPDSTGRDFGLPVLSGRGCKFRCNFCYRMDKGFRPRSPDAIIAEIRFLIEKYRVTRISFMDELLMSSRSRIEEICRALIKAKLNIKWGCSGRLNYAAPDILRLMKKAGCVMINYGIESIDDQALKNMHKNLTVDQIIRGIEATLKVGIIPGFNIIFGNIGETREILQKGVDFLIKYDRGAQLRTIRPVTPYPGSDLFDIAVQKGLLKDTADFYENKHLNSDLLTVNFTDMTDEEFHQALCDANKILIENFYRKRLSSSLLQTDELYLKQNINFRGYRHT